MPSPEKNARNLADIAADALTRLAEDLEHANKVPPGRDDVSWDYVNAERTVAESRRMAAGALERLAASFRDTSAPEQMARRQAEAVRGTIAPNVARGWAAAWRAYADR